MPGQRVTGIEPVQAAPTRVWGAEVPVGAAVEHEVGPGVEDPGGPGARRFPVGAGSRGRVRRRVSVGLGPGDGGVAGGLSGGDDGEDGELGGRAWRGGCLSRHGRRGGSPLPRRCDRSSRGWSVGLGSRAGRRRELVEARWVADRQSLATRFQESLDVPSFPVQVDLVRSCGSTQATASSGACAASVWAARGGASPRTGSPRSARRAPGRLGPDRPDRSTPRTPPGRRNPCR